MQKSEYYDIYCQTPPLLSKAKIRILTTASVAELQEKVLSTLFKSRSEELGPHEISLRKADGDTLDSTARLSQVFVDIEPPLVVDAYVLRISDLPFQLKLLINDQITEERFLSDVDFLRQYKKYFFINPNNGRTRTATFLLKSIRQQAYNNEVWLPSKIQSNK